MDAVIDDSPTQLVIAGAGTGKTTTLVGKVRHLIEHDGLDPRRILVISLTNNTVEDLKGVLTAEFGRSHGVNVMTIHALGNRITGGRPCVGAVKARLLGEICDDLFQSDRRSAREFLLFVDELRKTQFTDTSLNGRQIRMRGLRAVADALFECGFGCEYTAPVYTENERSPGYITAQLPGGRVFKAFSDDNNVVAAGRNPAAAWSLLEDRGVPVDRLNANDLASNVLSAWGNRIPDAFGNMISRCKCTGTTVSDLRKRNEDNPPYMRETLTQMLDLLDKVWDLYSVACVDKGLTDYDDMVIQSARALDAGLMLSFAFDAVLIDEYQDVSRILVDLVKSLRRSMGFKLFCVGDDWQSIYSFSGGDVWQMLEFESVWGEWGPISIRRIEQTYRSPQQIVDVAARFVSRNPVQQRKSIRGLPPVSPPPVQLLPVSNDKEIPRMIANRLEHIDPGESVFIIGRARSDLYALGYGSGQFKFEGSAGSMDVMFRRWDVDQSSWVDVRSVRFLTAHSSKGLEADYVFVIAEREFGGFPSRVSGDLDSLFVARDEGIELPEERRVFYVAMTRARKGLFLVSRMQDDGFALASDSEFLSEIIKDNAKMLVESTPHCPKCMGPMRIADSVNGPFYGCCAYPSCRGIRKFTGF